MNIENLEQLFSEKRLENYYRQFHFDKEKALQYYRINIQLSESFYPLLSNLEIALRNSIHHSCSHHFKSNDWYAAFDEAEIYDKIQVAKQKISVHKIEISPDTIVSELNLGFWTCLFNRKFAKLMWKPLIHALPNLTPQLRHRDKLSFQLNQIRKFRNRIFHYEPICNDLKTLATNHKSIYEILGWINEDLVVWTKSIDRFEPLYEQAVNFRTKN
jgi:hypothetical protein